MSDAYLLNEREKRKTIIEDIFWIIIWFVSYNMLQNIFKQY